LDESEAEFGRGKDIPGGWMRTKPFPIFCHMIAKKVTTGRMAFERENSAHPDLIQAIIGTNLRFIWGRQSGPLPSCLPQATKRTGRQAFTTLARTSSTYLAMSRYAVPRGRRA